jgi:hypothetical protein
MKVSINHQKEDPQAFTTSDGKQKKHAFMRLSQSVERAADVQIRKRAQRRTSGASASAVKRATLADHRPAQSIKAALTPVAHPSSNIPRPYYHFCANWSSVSYTSHSLPASNQ